MEVFYTCSDCKKVLTGLDAIDSATGKLCTACNRRSIQARRDPLAVEFDKMLDEDKAGPKGNVGHFKSPRAGTVFIMPKQGESASAASARVRQRHA